MFVKPTPLPEGSEHAQRIVRMPGEPRRVIPPEGMHVEDQADIRQLILHGDLEEAEAPPAPAEEHAP